MKRTVRVVMCAHQTVLGNPPLNAKYALAAIQEGAKMKPDIIVLPALSLTGASGAKLLENSALAESCLEQLNLIAAKTKSIGAYIIISCPARTCGGTAPMHAVLYRGQLLSREQPDAAPHLFDCGGICFAVSGASPEELCVNAPDIFNAGADLLINSCAVPCHARTLQNSHRAAEEVSRAFGAAVCICNGNLGESTAPNLYKSFCGAFECGEALAWQIDEGKPFHACADIDIDIVKSRRRSAVRQAEPLGKHICADKPGLLREVRRTPYLPADCREQVAAAEEIFDLQVRSLMGRLGNASIKKAVIGCSGGLDSTLALLVAAAALDRLGLPKNNLIGITMPGFGTTDRTHQNARKLMEGLGADCREIPIADAVLGHFKDINHPEDVRDAVYENAQARERTQILFDVANMEQAIVLGTGDLSEAALGWSTFGGDQFANFNVNICVNKTTARNIVEYISGSALFVDVSDILKDILSTPISPELLPDDGKGQLTEEILGDYILHDFYLYYFTQYGMAPSKIYEYALAAFGADYQPNEIRRTLVLFIRRFFSGQFKRSSAPEAAAILTDSLIYSRYPFPADASPEFLLQELNSAVNI